MYFKISFFQHLALGFTKNVMLINNNNKKKIIIIIIRGLGFRGAGGRSVVGVTQKLYGRSIFKCRQTKMLICKFTTTWYEVSKNLLI